LQKAPFVTPDWHRRHPKIPILQSFAPISLTFIASPKISTFLSFQQFHLHLLVLATTSQVGFTAHIIKETQ
jgi:hypothetical protein